MKRFLFFLAFMTGYLLLELQNLALQRKVMGLQADLALLAQASSENSGSISKLAEVVRDNLRESMKISGGAWFSGAGGPTSAGTNAVAGTNALEWPNSFKPNATSSGVISPAPRQRRQRQPSP